MRKPSLLIIFLTVFIDLVGFGIVLPLLPRYSERFGASGFVIGSIIASFSVMQFLFAPVWGRLSDRIGRRPVLLISNAGSAISYALFGLSAHTALSASASLWLLLASRVFGGLCGANLAVASAYIADITPREGRSKGMGLIGVAFGLGFILGPAIGAISAKHFGLAGPGWIAAVLCTGNFLLACVVLAESRKPGGEQAGGRPKLAQWLHTLGQPKLGLLVGLYFLSTFCFASFESTLPLLLGSPTFHPDDFRDPTALVDRIRQGADPVSSRLQAQFGPAIANAAGANPPTSAALRRRLFDVINEAIKSPALFDEAARASISMRPETKSLAGRNQAGDSAVRLNRLLLEDAYPALIHRQTFYYDEQHIGYLFAFCGLVSVFIQGGIIGRLVKALGEPRLIFGSLVVVAGALILIPYAATLGGLLAALALFSIGSGLNRAPTMGLISIFSPVDEQGATLGVAQSAGTLARIAGPIFAATLYSVRPHSPYVIAGGIAFASAGLAWWFLCRKA